MAAATAAPMRALVRRTEVLMALIVLLPARSTAAMAAGGASFLRNRVTHSETIRWIRVIEACERCSMAALPMRAVPTMTWFSAPWASSSSMALTVRSAICLLDSMVRSAMFLTRSMHSRAGLVGWAMAPGVMIAKSAAMSVNRSVWVRVFVNIGETFLH